MATVAGTAAATIDNSEYREKFEEANERKNRHRITAAGADVCPRYVNTIELVHASQITTVIADASYHPGLFVIKQVGTGTAGHTLTITKGSLDGTNNTATLNAINECLVLWFDSFGNGTIVENVGSVGLSAV